MLEFQIKVFKNPLPNNYIQIQQIANHRQPQKIAFIMCSTVGEFLKMSGCTCIQPVQKQLQLMDLRIMIKIHTLILTLVCYLFNPSLNKHIEVWTCKLFVLTYIFLTFFDFFCLSSQLKFPISFWKLPILTELKKVLYPHIM